MGEAMGQQMADILAAKLDLAADSKPPVDKLTQNGSGRSDLPFFSTLKNLISKKLLSHDKAELKRNQRHTSSWRRAKFRQLIKKGIDQVNVEVGYKITHIGEIDCLRAVFFLSFKLFMRWQDLQMRGMCKDFAERLHWRTYPEAYNALPPKMWAKFFMPELLVLNEQDLALTYIELKVTDALRGVVKASRYYRGFIAMNISTELRNFPFDFHDLRIIIRAHKFDKSKVRLVAWKGTAAIDTTMHTAEMNEWELVGHRSQAKDSKSGASTTGKVYSLFEIDIMVQRSHMWLVCSLVATLFRLRSSSLAILPPIAMQFVTS